MDVAPIQHCSAHQQGCTAALPTTRGGTYRFFMDFHLLQFLPADNCFIAPQNYSRSGKFRRMLLIAGEMTGPDHASPKQKPSTSACYKHR